MRKLFIFSIAAFALIFAFISFDTASNNNAFEQVVNNTNLAPSFAGEPPGTGERVSNTTYYTNTSSIHLLAWAHANTASQTAAIEMYINGVLVHDDSKRPLGSAENVSTAVDSIIPKNVSYRLNFSNYHHYEWREYTILSGKNGTLSINQTIFNNYTNITNGSQINNGSIQINESQVNNLTSDLSIRPSLVFHQKVINPITRINITGLDINRDGYYYLIAQLTTPSSGVPNGRLFVNGDENISNYTRQFLFSSGSLVLSVRDNDPGILGTSALNSSSVAKETILLDGNGYAHYLSEAGLDQGNLLTFFNGEYTYNNKITNITKLEIVADVSNGIYIGSEFWLYRS